MRRADDILKTQEAPALVVNAIGRAEQYLTFFVNGEEYGVDILRVQEIRSYSRGMPIPNSPPYIKGVINIRGDIVPIADLRERLGLPTATPTRTTALVILLVKQGGRSRTMGVVVDAMSDVTTFGAEALKPSPSFGTRDDKAALTSGIATHDHKMITILDVDRIFPTPAEIEGD